MSRSRESTNWRIVWTTAVCAVVAGALPTPAAAQCYPHWLPGGGIPGTDGGGVDGEVRAMTTWDPDGPGPQPEVLVVGGYFAHAGSVAANNIACWDPAASTWSPLGQGIGTGYDGPVSALAVLDGKLYAAGNFRTAGGVSANRIACWDPATQTWSPLGSGLGGAYDRSVNALAVLDGKLYAGGSFTIAGGLSANYIACWDPATQTWSPLGSGTAGGDYPYVQALAALDGKLVAGGRFTTAGGVGANYIACWDPSTSSWSPMGSPTFGSVDALVVLDGRLYTAAWQVYCWDPATLTWSPLGSGMNNRVLALTGLEGKLYAGGPFTKVGSLFAEQFACWDPVTQTWSPLGSGTTDGGWPYVQALTALNGKLYAGGALTRIGAVGVNGVACWDPDTASWSPLGSGMGGLSEPYVHALTVLNGKVYAGGDFITSAGGVVANHIVCWDPATSTWSALGSGTNWGVSALTVLDGRLYAGGFFQTAGGVSVNYVACWDPATSTWSALGSGLDWGHSVYALAVLDGKLYVGGNFTSAGGTKAYGIACWDAATQTWSALGLGLRKIVHALAVLNGKLYAGGEFATAGGVSANKIACWDPATQTWSILGSGVAATYPYVYVRALGVLNGKLYVGGQFSTAGGVSTNNIACWDPDTSTWSALGSGMNASVRALTVRDGTLYAGGRFTSAGGGNASGVAAWSPDTQTWSPLGSGIPIANTSTSLGGVFALAVLDDGLYAGGNFVIAGGQVSAYWARWAFCPQPTIIAGVSRRTHGTAGSFDIDVAGLSQIESRRGGATNVLIGFDKAIRRTGGTLDDVQVSQGSVTSLAVNDSTLDIGIGGAFGPEALTVSFPGIAASDTGAVVGQTLCFMVLPGDASGDGLVNVSDYVAVRDHIGQAVDSTTCHCDINADGAIDTSDFVAVRGRVGMTAGTCP